MQALDQLRAVVDVLQVAGVNIHIDLSESPGFHYHTGLVFAAYLPSHGKAIGNGGRYDAIGKDFGRARAATGFAFDLKVLANLGQMEVAPAAGIFVPYCEEPSKRDEIARLRATGKRVVEGFAGQPVCADEMRCDRQLVWLNGTWQLQNL